MNLTCSASVVTILNDVLADVHSTVRHLSLKMDGATENWNKVVLGFCHILVASDRFDEVQISRK